LIKIVRLLSKPTVVEWGFVVLLAGACGLLSLLQYRWTGEISRAETDRLRGELAPAAAALGREFDDALTTDCSALVPAEDSVRQTNRNAVHLQLFRRFHAQCPQSVFHRIGVVVPSQAGFDLFEQNQTTGELAPAAWPAEWDKLRRHFDDGGPYRDNSGLLIEFPVFGPSQSENQRESEWVILELDTNCLQRVWIPQLIQRHLSAGSQQVCQVIIKTLGVPPITIFSTANQIAEASKPISVPFNPEVHDLERHFERPSEFQWTLELYLKPGALEKLVAAERVKNLGIAVFLNGLIFATGLLLVRHIRHSRRLAEQQMHFVAGISHELRTPLTVIRGAAHNLQRGVVCENGEIEKYAGLITEHVAQLSEMIEQVLALAGAQKNKVAALRRPVALVDVLRNAVAATAHDTQAAQCHVHLELPPSLPIIMGDRSALRRVFQNLIANAAKHGGDGKWIGLTAVSYEDSHPQFVEVQVADRGPGVPHRERAEIFKPFVRGALARSLQKRGSGLGLSLAKEIITAHGGEIAVRGAAGGGAIFVVRLPAAKNGESR
jgi:signal transduction histidine kinase